jgi:transcriptional regulator with XRE-family HTH domain
MDKIGEKIKNAREVKNLTQDYVAKKLGITQRAYSKIENDEVNIVVNKLLEIAKILGVSPNEFLPSEGSHVYNNIVTSQKGNGFVINQAEKAIELYDKLLKTKDELIIAKENYIKQLESQIKNKHF